MPKEKRKVTDAHYAPYPHLSMYSASASYTTDYKHSGASSVPSSSILNIVDAKYGYRKDTSTKLAEKVTTKRAISEKRQRKKADAQPEEKRGAIFKKACPKNILERVDRVISQRFFLIDRKRNGKELREEFSVLGSTGNARVYTVVIDKKPTCNCPDASKGNHCKHILFVYLKVLQVPHSSTHWHQKALLTTELQEILNGAPPAPNAFASSQIRDAYARATGSTQPSGTGQESGKDSASNSKRRVPGEGDDCPICYEGMAGDAQSPSKLTYCESCGNALHTECFRQWANSARGNVTCVWCRAKWVSPAPSGGISASASSGRAGISREGYVNLSGVAGVSPARDTSSYYHGPRRGQRYYGYQDYDEDDVFL